MQSLVHFCWFSKRQDSHWSSASYFCGPIVFAPMVARGGDVYVVFRDEEVRTSHPGFLSTSPLYCNIGSWVHCLAARLQRALDEIGAIKLQMQFHLEFFDRNFFFSWCRFLSGQKKRSNIGPCWVSSWSMQFVLTKLQSSSFILLE